MDTWKENNLSVYTVYATSVDLGKKRPGYGLQEMYNVLEIPACPSEKRLSTFACPGQFKSWFIFV